ncbi:MAG TPA: hypothetical protein H9837_11010, partial [Candidatus Brachybacterium merdigallinarum]|nr:hypothetical protein [Candidatus Brachybacterium merdigallinarum]
MTSPDHASPDRTSPDLPRGRDGDLPTVLVDQIEFHLREQIRPRLQGLTDEEYFFDPSGDGDIWTVHPRAAGGDAPAGDDAPAGGEAPGEAPPTLIQGGSGEMVIDVEFPEPDSAPLTTIARRLGHVIVGVLAMRSH